jgi:hypothetical protein
MKQQTDTPTPKDAPSSAFASAEEMSHPPELQGNRRKGREIRGTDEEMSRPPELQGNPRKRSGKPNNSVVVPNMVPPTSQMGGDGIVMVQQLPTSLYRQERERRGDMRANDEEEDASSDASSDEEMRPGAVAVPGLFTGRTSPSVLDESQAPSAIDEQSVIMGELAPEPFQKDQELRRRCQELQEIVNQTVTGTAIVEKSSDHDQDTTSSPFGRKERRLLIGAAFALLLVVGVILGVTIPLTTNNDKNSPSIDSAVTPIQSPAPTAAPTACTSLDCLAELLLGNEVADAEALQDESSPQFLALRWLANNDLDLDSMPTVILVERYVLAVFFFATSADGGLNVLNFLTVSSVCEWTGVFCNGDDLVVALLLGKSKHEEVIFLIETFRIDSPVYFPFSFSGVGV